MRKSSLLLTALSLATLFAASVAAQSPNLTGTWLFDRTRSDNVLAKIGEALGSENTQGGKEKEFQRVWIRGWLLGVAENPDNRLLTVTQTPKEFQSGLGDELSIFYFGRKGTSRGPSGGNMTTSVEWRGGALETEEKSDKDKGRISSRYLLDPDGKTLRVTFRLEHRSLHLPLEALLVFTRANP